MSQSYLRSIYIRLAGAVTLIVALSLAINAYFSQVTFERALAPDMAKKVVVAAGSTRALILEALEHSIPVADIYGIDQTFDELKATVPDIGYAALTDTRGKVLFERFTGPLGVRDYFKSADVLALLESNEPPPSVRVGEQYIVSLPVRAPQGAVGILHVGVSVEFVNRILADMLFDVIVVLLVALFFAIELLHFLAGRRIEASLNALGSVIERGRTGDFTTAQNSDTRGLFGSVVGKLDTIRASVNKSYGKLARDIDASRQVPAHERTSGMNAARAGMLALAKKYRFGTVVAPRERMDDDKLARVRAPLFTFMLAEDLTRSFLPGYAKSLLVSVPGLSPEIVVGLPIVLFMLIVALGQPLMGVFASRVGSRRAMLVGASIAGVGFIASAFAYSVLDLLLWRSLCALGYGFVFVAAQAHVLEYSNARNRAGGFAVFIGAIMVATVCGPSIGGILADNIGERQTFALAGLIALASIFMIRMMPGKDEERAGPPATLPKWKDFATLLLNLRFMTVTGLAAVPAKMLLTGMCFYLVPLYLLHLGSTQAMAGRVLMVYGVMMVVMMPVAARLAKSRRTMEQLVSAGLVVSGLGGLMLTLGEGVPWVFVAVFLVGLGQSLSIAAQSALIREHCPNEVARMGESAVYGVYRLLERTGNAVGPIAAALLVVAVGYRTSFIVAGASVLACGIAFFCLTQLTARASAPRVAAASARG